MTNIEFSNEFDVLYNSITSNQAPGLDEYEKSVFLTKAQADVLRSYFDSRSNKIQEGFDDSAKRQIDFSYIIDVKKYKTLSKVMVGEYSYPANPKTYEEFYNYVINASHSIIDSEVYKKALNDGIIESTELGDKDEEGTILVDIYPPGFKNPDLDDREETRAFILPKNILFIINEFAVVNRYGCTLPKKLVVIPISYDKYSKLMTKPFTRPAKNQAWRLINSITSRKIDVVVGPGDEIVEYSLRYVRRPRPIIVGPLDGQTIEGCEYNPEENCELDPIIHQEILQRAVELAKSAYMGDLQSQIALGQSSQTDVGITQVSNRQ